MDYSSYETTLGRSEWIKVYGEMTDTSELARQLSARRQNSLTAYRAKYRKNRRILLYKHLGTGCNPKTGDYVTKMIDCGRREMFENLGDDKATSSVTMEMEQFYSQAKMPILSYTTAP